MATLTIAPRTRFIVALGMLLSILIPFAAQPAGAQTAGKAVVYPGSVHIEPGVCADGEFLQAIVSVPSDTPDDGIFYTITQPDFEGYFKVHAQVGDDFVIGETLGTGWERTNDWNAWYSGIAPLPMCDQGPTARSASVQDASTGDKSDDVNLGLQADVGSSRSALTIPQDCGTPPYDAPTGENVTDQISFSNYVITHNEVAHVGGPIVLTAPNETLMLSFFWTAAEPVYAGQYFVFEGPVDAIDEKVFTSSTQWFPVMSIDGTAQAGCASVVGGDITVQLSDYVHGRSPVEGRIDLSVEVAAGATGIASTIEFAFDDESAFAIEVPGITLGAFEKNGWFERDDQGLVENLDAIQWHVHVPASPHGYTNLVVSDLAPVDGSWTFSCVRGNATRSVVMGNDAQVPAAPVEFVETCGAGALTIAIADVPAGMSLDVYFLSDITPGAGGPFVSTTSVSVEGVEMAELARQVDRTVGNEATDSILVAAPIAPAVEHAQSVNGLHMTGWVTVPIDQPGVSYTISPDPIPEEGGPVVVTAALQDGYTWSDDAEGDGWVQNPEGNTMVYETVVQSEPEEVAPPMAEADVSEEIAEEAGIPAEAQAVVTDPSSVSDSDSTTPLMVTALPETGIQGPDSSNTWFAVATMITLIVGAAGAVILRENRR